MLIANDGTEIFETGEHDAYTDSFGNTRYRQCDRCGGYFPEDQMVVGNIDGIYCLSCDEDMYLIDFDDLGATAW